MFSSEQMYKVLDLGARVRDSWESRVDLPVPGWPAMRVTEPAVRPPPRTRSNSDIWVEV